MRLIETTSRGVQYFVLEHSKFYRKIQFEFLDAVESLNPQNIAVYTCIVFSPSLIHGISMGMEWILDHACTAENMTALDELLLTQIDQPQIHYSRIKNENTMIVCLIFDFKIIICKAAPTLENGDWRYSSQSASTAGDARLQSAVTCT